MDRKLTLGDRLKVRSMIYVAGEPIPRFWPMRTFIHHNPLFGLEHLPFPDAVEEGSHLFHGRGYLPRSHYQRYRAEGKIDDAALRRYLQSFLREQSVDLPGIDLETWLWTIMTECRSERLVQASDWLDGEVLAAALQGRQAAELDETALLERLRTVLGRKIASDGPLYDNIDRLFGTKIGDTLDELLVKSCLDFFDEGQSAWQAPSREKGFFASWKDVAQHNLRFTLLGLHLRELLASSESPEGSIAHILHLLKIPEDHWQKYITRQLTRLHGWAGFIRFRSSAKHYYWAQQYPADLADYLAVRMVLGLSLVQEAVRHHGCPGDAEALQQFVHDDPYGAYLRSELHAGTILPAWAQRVDDALARRSRRGYAPLAKEYIQDKRTHEAERKTRALRALAGRVGSDALSALQSLTPEQVAEFVNVLRRWERAEGFAWLRAMESHYITDLVRKVRLPEDHPKKRPFAQAFFCIDVRSEPMRRHLEALGDYQTFGIAGFFGVPIGFLEYGKGSEVHLCPAVQTPKNLIVEIPAELELEEEPLYGALEHVLHDIKSSVLSPFVAVEAVGLIFSLGLIGKTVAPVFYHETHGHLHAAKPVTRLLVDKLNAEQADSIIRAVQRAMIVRALQRELGMDREHVTDDEIRELREIALGNRSGKSALANRLALTPEAEAEFIDKLRSVYRVDRYETSLQMERIARLGFTLDEQVRYVSNALLSTGLSQNFSRFVLMVGHESQTQNNPYESALDCGACGGGRGLPNARVICTMANKPEVRRRLLEKGIAIPEDTWFLPAVHNTTTDEITLHDLDLLPARHLLYLERLQNGLTAATRRTAAERMPTLGASRALAAEPIAAAALARRHAHDWSQVRPEWGLSRNLYGIIGGRHLTEGVDLQGRSFLQSYDYRLDPKGRFLENILSAPVVVGEWINLEHYFSTTDVHHYGSGSKAYHNVAGRFGVMTGNQSDLRTGLPIQSMYQEGKPYHEPVRLIALVEAPAGFVLAAVGRLPKVKALIMGGWLRVIVIDPEDDYRCLVLEEGEFQVHPESGRQYRQSLLEASA
ncbi:DUF2309 domain-containing protein [Acidithiobacillus sp. CV18-2]|uniref:Probable inorganic carbon transporter subunit DabA n=1 Tax=Igneacidithiobacillus copahuensis TaxID=2724909 RepID=A0AAE3CKJ7_9PROT|nr:DUF2309 domain-containing protein [Igneacidithiobacillus copahuensis]MBU2754132.1 DUF2309 domain-containing protein [Acidithiobacillus sp. CV18-3]MBU2757009.1 DUF2309 domain-containing protein [Acidithiobacillus sp. BN09-2]MBU2777821.1 DUF2309 domain-containing protein [Acidithiobacillus sp. CV18-2]MBU2795568.1 DUF2309 domain-containing protein [Acidithiobacillus sp. VAN18-2]MBU2798796.1 DUF2309 domain-containing protein [Acidithiobacillus sp. VAN18-4]UTV81801.1 DUF2309 domain-containing p